MDLSASALEVGRIWDEDGIEKGGWRRRMRGRDSSERTLDGKACLQ